MAFTTREEWLTFIAGKLAPAFEDLGAPLPTNVRVSIGFTSHGARGKAIGQCWDNARSDDHHFEIFIVPNLAEAADAMPLQVAAILAHELVHAAVGIPAGHGPEFRKVAVGLGLQGKMTATVPGPAFVERIQPILAEAGPLPHARLNTTTTGTGTRTGPKPQTKRHIKCRCEQCGYTARTTRMWIDNIGAPHCPAHGAMAVHE